MAHTTSLPCTRDRHAACGLILPVPAAGMAAWMNALTRFPGYGLTTCACGCHDRRRETRALKQHPATS